MACHEKKYTMSTTARVFNARYSMPPSLSRSSSERSTKKEFLPIVGWKSRYGASPRDLSVPECRNEENVPLRVGFVVLSGGSNEEFIGCLWFIAFSRERRRMFGSSIVI